MAHDPTATHDVDEDQLRRIDPLCNEFEAALQRGERPRASEFLERAAAEDRSELLYWMLRSEIELRQHSGESCQLQDYLSAWPSDGAIVRRAFGEQSTFDGGGSQTDGGVKVDPLALPRRFGKYELLEVLGQGGMGVVYKATQFDGDRPLRTVALKLIRPDRLIQRAGEASSEYLQRFRQEALLATKLEHERIVRVYDVGDEGGQPYFSMQYVAGRSLAERLDTGPLPAREAAAMLRGVAEAIAYAHERGVVHRDLKPRNILLDERGAPWVADFGLARESTGVDLSATELPNGTAPYMAPEQARGKHVGPAADIYGLGATLYELLTGRPPFRAAATAETLLLVLTTEPVAPRELNPKIPRDIETICLKCLDKHPTRRYASAKELAEDLRRFTENIPVLARPVGNLEKAARWCRRNPWIAGLGMIASLLVLTFAIGGPVVASVVAGQNVELTWATTAANQRRLEAIAAQRDAEAAAERERIANLETKKRLAQLQRANKLLSDVFNDLDPRAEQQEGVSLRVILGRRLARAAQDLDKEAVGDPLVVANLQHELAVSLYELGRPAEAATVHARAYETRLAKLGPRHADTLNSMSCLGDSCFSSGQTLRGLELQERALATMREVLPAEHIYRTSSMNNLARVYADTHRIPEAVALLEEMVAIREDSLGPDHLDTLVAQSNLAELYTLAGEPAKALKLQKTAVDGMRRTLVPDHPRLLAALGNLARAYIAEERLDDAIELLRETLKKMERTWGPTHVQTVRYLHNLGSIYFVAERYEEAIASYEETLRRMARNADQSPSDRLSTMGGLAGALKAVGRLEESIALYEKTLADIRDLPGGIHPDKLGFTFNLARAYFAADQPEQGLKMLDAYVAGKRTIMPGDEALTYLLASTGLDLLNYRQHAAAERYLRECLTLCEKNAPDDWTRFHVQSMLGAALVGQREFAAAEPLLLGGYEGMRDRAGKIPPPTGVRLQEALRRLVILYTNWEKPKEAAHWQNLLETAIQGSIRSKSVD